ncbi:hypothetical protein CEUSTIGMA_g8373.t1 [Chlamydomonas eustigma]|uniref:Smr domain-containing protein n=1 Tax=Chlamydomonas eustigma TaxID=1157962 RepID=A0A250XCX2_9CHLO|nr:hypothetical protein CEUSTIGMA_g8373.t1 [Chlamydomonas eustigma]|eukprot:GAX80938.1 hypothetical protein CEUSTIGMA_g8373.t1 [Chlamydomonas eustigma]
MGNFTSTLSPAEKLVSQNIGRDNVNKLYCQRNEIKQRSQEAYRRGDGHAAKMLSTEAKEIDRQAKEAQAKVAQEIFDQNNCQRCDGMVDLHGLHVAEAEAVAEKILRGAKRDGKGSVIFIVGRGLHSKDGVAKLKPAIERLINKHNLRCHPDTPHAGCVFAEFVSREDRGWFWGLLKGCSIM